MIGGLNPPCQDLEVWQLAMATIGYALKFGDCVGSFTPVVSAGPNILKVRRLQRITILGQIAFSLQDAVHTIDSVSAHLSHPQTICLRCDSGDLHFLGSPNRYRTELESASALEASEPVSSLVTETIAQSRLLQWKFS